MVMLNDCVLLVEFIIYESSQPEDASAQVILRARDSVVIVADTI